MSEMNQSSDDVGLRVTVSIPNCSDGFVVLHDAATSAHIAAYEVTRILFYSRGTVGTSDEACFSFTLSRGDCQETAIFQCHVFRCHIPEAVSQVSGECTCSLLLLFLGIKSPLSLQFASPEPLSEGHRPVYPLQ